MPKVYDTPTDIHGMRFKAIEEIGERFRVARSKSWWALAKLLAELGPSDFKAAECANFCEFIKTKCPGMNYATACKLKRIAEVFDLSGYEVSKIPAYESLYGLLCTKGNIDPKEYPLLRRAVLSGRLSYHRFTEERKRLEYDWKRKSL